MECLHLGESPTSRWSPWAFGRWFLPDFLASAYTSSQPHAGLLSCPLPLQVHPCLDLAFTCLAMLFQIHIGPTLLIRVSTQMPTFKEASRTFPVGIKLFLILSWCLPSLPCFKSGKSLLKVIFSIDCFKVGLPLLGPPQVGDELFKAILCSQQRCQHLEQFRALHRM